MNFISATKVLQDIQFFVIPERMIEHKSKVYDVINWLNKNLKVLIA